MKCPVCETILQMAVREGVEIDYCPKCRGIWLDRGELDKLIERATQSSPRGTAAHDDDSGDFRRVPPPGYPPASGHTPPPTGKPHKTESFWSRIFDFD